MTDRPAAGDARRRADEAGSRARELRERLDAVQAGTGPLRGSSPDDLRLAETQAARATDRLRRALESSADAHDRAATGHESLVRKADDPTGTHAERAAAHRRYAAADRDRAAVLPDPEPSPGVGELGDRRGGPPDGADPA